MTIAFDLDDTLFPEIEYVRSAYRAIAAAYDRAELIELMESAPSPREAFDLAAQAIGIADATPLLRIYREHRPDISLAPDVERVLTNLRDRGITLALITDGRSLTQRHKITALRLERFFSPELIFISEEPGADKTTPTPFILTEKSADSSPYFYIGDNPAKDFRQARLRGWTTLMIKGDARNIHSQDVEAVDEDSRPHRIINSWEELSQMACL